MYIRLDVFAGLLNVRPGEVLHAARTDGVLDGMTLPARRQVRGAALMFDQAEAVSFAEQWHAREPEAGPEASGAPLMTLNAVAREADIAPLVLWQAASRGKRLRGVALPVAAREGGQLLFEPAAVTKFVTEYRKLRPEK
ncbi:hypothetical protein QMZ65_23065 [Pantoea sp. EABMAA-21]|uniref:hypothetical protein n=1 Tax=Pantoea sp. EABMAA-21 TaxID=3043302 RepID=UPI0024B58737|nr:hypothetical protein [Pantoea sp. EABMAA-21]MDI9280103.1 hypothetical protein [Pantoea sp. EABMAA-21]